MSDAPPGGAPLVVTADDYGLTDATCRAILDAHRLGIVTATSVLAVAPGVDRRLAWLADAPALSVGVHLAVVGEDPPLLSAAEIPTLVDRRGRLARSWRALVGRAVTGRVDPADLRREFGAQVERVAAMAAPTHLDSHQHVHLWPVVGEVVVDLAVERDIGAVRVPRSNRRGPRAGRIGALADRLAARAVAAGLATTERFAGLDEAGRWSEGSLVAALGALAGAGSAEINAHPGARADADRDRYRWGYRWGQEADALQAPSVRDAVAAHGFALTGR